MVHIKKSKICDLKTGHLKTVKTSEKNSGDADGDINVIHSSPGSERSGVWKEAGRIHLRAGGLQRGHAAKRRVRKMYFKNLTTELRKPLSKGVEMNVYDFYNPCHHRDLRGVKFNRAQESGGVQRGDESDDASKLLVKNIRQGRIEGNLNPRKSGENSTRSEREMNNVPESDIFRQ